MFMSAKNISFPRWLSAVLKLPESQLFSQTPFWGVKRRSTPSEGLPIFEYLLVSSIKTKQNKKLWPTGTADHFLALTVFIFNLWLHLNLSKLREIILLDKASIYSFITKAFTLL